MGRKFLLILLLLILAGAGLCATWWQNHGDPDRRQLVLYGNIERRDARLVFPEQDIVAEILAEEGDLVSEGQVLARLRNTRLEQQLRQARAQVRAQAQVVRRLEKGPRPQEIDQIRTNIAMVRSKIANARETLDRLEKTARLGASSAQTRDNARTTLAVETAQLKGLQLALDLALEGSRAEDIAQARAVLDGDQAQVAYLQARLADTVLKAPAAGIIQSRLLEPGELAGPSQPVFVLALTTPKWARCYISEPDLGRIREGLTVGIRSDSWPDRIFPGQVGFISPVAEFTPRNVETSDLRTKLVYELRIQVEDPQNELRLGMPVTVQLSPSPAPGQSRP